MNAWQAFRQIKSILQAAVWPGTSTPVFASTSVVVSAGTALEFARSLRLPAVLIRPGSAQGDPEYSENPDLITQEISIQLFQMVPGDATGELCLLGSDHGVERGYGLMQIEERVLAEVGLVNALEGVELISRSRSFIGAEVDQYKNYLAHRSYLFDLVCQAQSHYQPATGFTATVAGGTVTLSWSLPSARYDIVGAVLRRAAGSTAPAAYNAGSGVTLATQLDLTVDDTPGSGTWSYALFVQYSDGATSYSAAVNQEGVVVA